ncbi:MAG: acetyl-CoA carboxylase biotin carboxyl carrier protein subunit [Bacteroidetes bacterium]|nr:acetyl-CoA carboxylase biotin carboxyl carrier protein subunit [Bacteroidota bacterium]
MSKNSVVVNELKMSVNLSDYSTYIINGINRSAFIDDLMNGVFLIRMGSATYEALIVEQNNNQLTLLIEGKYIFVNIKTELEELSEEILSHSKNKTHNIKIFSPMPGLIVQIDKNEGDSVNEGDKLFVLEAMKMENVVYSPVAGKIKNLFKIKGDSTDKNELIMVIE